MLTRASLDNFIFKFVLLVELHSFSWWLKIELIRTPVLSLLDSVNVNDIIWLFFLFGNSVIGNTLASAKILSFLSVISELTRVQVIIRCHHCIDRLVAFKRHNLLLLL